MRSSPIVRGCGTRVMGAAYLEVPLGPGGTPVEDFLVDPPQRIHPAQLGLSAVGVSLIPRGPDGPVDVYDWVGADSYPNVADFIEETRRFGISRRITAHAAFEQLSRDSLLVLVHPRAWLMDSAAYLTERRRGCPTHIPAHAPDAAPWPEMCASLWWEDIEGGYHLEEEAEPYGAAGDSREVFRAFPPAHPQFRYAGRERPDHVTAPAYAPAIFCVLPLARIAVVRDPAGGSHEQTAARASCAGIRMELVDE
jgi:hypothetical protein